MVGLEAATDADTAGSRNSDHEFKGWCDKKLKGFIQPLPLALCYSQHGYRQIRDVLGTLVVASELAKGGSPVDDGLSNSTKGLIAAAWAGANISYLEHGGDYRHYDPSSIMYSDNLFKEAPGIAEQSGVSIKEQMRPARLRIEAVVRERVQEGHHIIVWLQAGPIGTAALTLAGAGSYDLGRVKDRRWGGATKGSVSIKDVLRGAWAKQDDAFAVSALPVPWSLHLS